MPSIYEDDVKTPAEADAIIERKKKKYRDVHTRFKQAQGQKCDCDRSSCSRCLEVDELMNQMRRILY